MHAPYRIAQPPEPERTEEADSYEQSLVATRHAYLLKLAFGVLVGASVFGFTARAAQRHISPHERARALEEERIAHARAVIEDTRAQADREDAWFDAALHEAFVAHPTTKFAACTTELGPPERMLRGHSVLPMLVVHDPTVPYRLWSPSIANVERDIRSGEDLLASANPAAATTYSEAFEQTPFASRVHRDVVLVPRKWQSAIRNPDSPTTFEPGQVDGIAYVYDFQAHRVTCMGEIHATSSRKLEYTFNDSTHATWLSQATRLDESLSTDLELQVARAITAPNALYALE